MYLRERLSARRNYTFILTVQTRQQGEETTVGDGITEVPAWIIPTQGRTPTSDIFLKHTSASLVPEVSVVGFWGGGL